MTVNATPTVEVIYSFLYLLWFYKISFSSDLYISHLGNVIKKLNKIRIAINLQYQQPFPKSKSRLLSSYSFVPRRIKIKSSGEIAGGLARFVTSLIDFSFVRSVAGPAYSPVGGHAYDPVSLFLLELFQYLEKFPDLKTFLSFVRDEEKGRHYRLCAGISSSHIPCEADFTHLKGRLEETLYTEIAQVLGRDRPPLRPPLF